MTTARTSPSATRGALALGVVAQARESSDALKQLRTWWLDRTNFSLHLNSDDPLYADAHSWVLGLLAPESRRRLRAKTTAGPSGDAPVAVDDEDAASPAARLVITSRDNSPQKVLVDGHAVSVMVHTHEEPLEKLYRPDTLAFTSRTRAGQLAVQANLERLLELRSKAARRPIVRLLNTSWGSWSRRGDLPPRPLESVVLAAGQMERLVTDLGNFLGDEAAYNSRAIPWHRGYLLQGPPGTGKTSIARALASHFGMDLWYAPLGDVKDDSNLLNLLSQIHPRSMLLLEDVDVFAATQDRDADNDTRLSLSGLLNALDGVATPHGLVTVMTTNNPEVLDDALLRAGRMDLIETIDLPDDDQARRMYEAFYGQPAKPSIVAAGRSASAIAEILKRNLRTPDQAEQELSQPW